MTEEKVKVLDLDVDYSVPVSVLKYILGKIGMEYLNHCIDEYERETGISFDSDVEELVPEEVEDLDKDETIVIYVGNQGYCNNEIVGEYTRDEAIKVIKIVELLERIAKEKYQDEKGDIDWDAAAEEVIEQLTGQ